MANKVAFTTIKLHIRKPPNDKIKSLLTGGGPCDNRTTRVLFIKEVGIHLAANHFTSEGPRGSRGGEGKVG